VLGDALSLGAVAPLVLLLAALSLAATDALSLAAVAPLECCSRPPCRSPPSVLLPAALPLSAGYRRSATRCRSPPSRRWGVAPGRPVARRRRCRSRPLALLGDVVGSLPSHRC
jgi:hypothetical protein